VREGTSERSPAVYSATPVRAARRGHVENRTNNDMIIRGAPGPGRRCRRLLQRHCKSGVSSNRARTVSPTVRGVTEPDATGPSPAATGLPGASRHAGQVVRRVLLRRNIVIDAETAELVAAAVQAALQAEEAKSSLAVRRRAGG
jgi:hypothetical protein